MICFTQGVVSKIVAQRAGISEIIVETEAGEEPALNYDQLTGTIDQGDRVVVNTTAVRLGLGSGGCHFVMANLNNTGRECLRPGHIIKMRYSPTQVKVQSVEEAGSPYYEQLKRANSLDGMPVVLGLLHSMLPYAVAGIKAANKGLRVAYIMTDGGALPLPFSKLVPRLKKAGLLDATVTVGHAFGGDVEAVNIYTGLLAARAALKADVAVVVMGPGITGTGSRFGFSGIEQADIINVVDVLGGRPFVIPRISAADLRPRHQGVSHHTRTVLELTRAVATVVFPQLPEDRREELTGTMQQISNRHRVLEITGLPAHKLLMEKDIQVRSMGRGFDDDPMFFLAAGACGLLAGRRAVKAIGG